MTFKLNMDHSTAPSNPILPDQTRPQIWVSNDVFVAGRIDFKFFSGLKYILIHKSRVK